MALKKSSRVRAKKPDEVSLRVGRAVHSWIETRRGEGMDQQKFAALIDRSRQMVNNLVNGRENVGRESVRRIAEVIGVDWKSFYSTGPIVHTVKQGRTSRFFDLEDEKAVDELLDEIVRRLIVRLGLALK